MSEVGGGAVDVFSILSVSIHLPYFAVYLRASSAL